MRFGDSIIQYWRMKVAARWIPGGSQVLDVGCHQGEFLKFLGKKIVPSVGIDPLCEENHSAEPHLLIRKEFHPNLPFDDGSFDAVVLLATIEHMQQKTDIAKESRRLLRKGGRVIITVPSLLVDKILSILLFLRMVDGMSLEEHHGFSPDELPGIFLPEGFTLKARKKFQFGLNNLFVFERL